MLVAVWSEVTERRSPGSGAAVCAGGGAEVLVHEAASTPSRKASLANARGGDMVRDDDTAPLAIVGHNLALLDVRRLSSRSDTGGAISTRRLIATVMSLIAVAVLGGPAA